MVGCSLVRRPIILRQESKRPRSGALHNHQVRLGRLESHGKQRRVLGGVIPATSTLHVGELQQYDALGLPGALPHLEFPTPYSEATTVLLDRGRNQLAVFRQSGLVMHVDIDDHICCHSASFRSPDRGPPPGRARTPQMRTTARAEFFDYIETTLQRAATALKPRVSLRLQQEALTS